MRDRCEKLVSFPLIFTYNLQQRVVLEYKCHVFLLITNG